MKKLLILFIIMLGISGCSNLNNTSIDNIINDTLNEKNNLSNQYRQGFSYYLPTNLSSIKSDGSNEVLSNGLEKYYLYVDLVSFYNATDIKYVVNNNAYYSKEFNYNDKNGYIEINVNNDKYLIEIIYNYAKIEVMVDKENINEAIAEALIVLSSTKYNKDVIDTLMSEDTLSYGEEKFTIFNDDVNDSNFLEYVQEYDNYEESEIPDYDLIN